ncbi:M4 family metallopeptidase [Cognatiluteimonas weifangensis]|uniref:Neutral metalloproteinase n=1 Tax=Cognatiluteimonas weifangensis TaxID=2303539 RepID=A0A372DH58_9GAMM|nr:M4 family metallopeptidase [Luteimonas weifangensis]RFP58240.1 peptidase M4 family protein [Luteimonas weifangensis]
MKVQSCLLSAAIVAALAVSSAPALAAGNAKAGAVARAHGLVDGPAARAVRRAAADAFVAGDVVVDANGTEHVRFSRTYRGLPVIGGDFVLHSRHGQVRGVSQTLKTSARPDLSPRVSRSQAIAKASARFGLATSTAPRARLVVYALGASPVLAHEVMLSGIKADQTPTDMRYFIDARNGRVLNQWDTVQTAKPGPGGSCTPAAAVGTGKTLTLGNVALDTVKCGTQYQMKDLVRGGGYTTNMANRQIGLGTIFVDADNSWGNNALTDAATVAADAHYGVSRTWDYFKNVHGRNGIANDGQGALSRVHYGRKYVNAFWSDSCFCMTFGDGDNGVTYNPLVALDVAGHEMSHGVTSRSADLVYSGESGGLNEATSDIFGTMVEYYANNASDPADYMIGENVFARNPGTMALRYMFKPSLDGASPDCYSGGLGGLDVHYSSGVANHFYYLLAEGAVVPAGFGAGTAANLTPGALVCNGNTAIVGIGRDAAGKIWYRALTTYMTSGTNYAGARVATLSAATDLFGAGSTQYNAVAAAWSAVSVN